ncbi:dtdp-d-glucose 46-dehydratase-related [Anaeramoeba flamelloides]|uniref:Dtdp-d-glucose 46-dehydratase-related n=1 Tax=Anaeramoeba flamelloides TaxID=1746091 RepID=A0AAV7YDW7_9EUKA|nr:dtdp-d-glucose 46-dehydratase-related [Anaeramoeba flamelloides]
MNILVTGSTGHVGSNLVRALVDHCKPSTKINCLILKHEEKHLKKWFGNLPLNFIAGDLTNYKSMQSAMKGIDQIYHCAGLVGINQTQTMKDMWKVNVLGSRNLSKAAVNSGTVQKMVQVSTCHILQDENGSDFVTNEGLYDPCDEIHTEYDLVKTLADLESMKFMARGGLDLCFVHPSGVIGKYDWKLNGHISQTIKDCAEGKLPCMPSTGGSGFVSAEDLAHVLIATMERGKKFHRYLASNETLGVVELLGIISRETGCKLPRKLPLSFIEKLATCKDWINKNVFNVNKRWKQAQSFGRESLGIVRAQIEYDKSVTERELGIKLGSIEKSIVQQINWMREIGLVKLKKKVKESSPIRVYV